MMTALSRAVLILHLLILAIWPLQPLLAPPDTAHPGWLATSLVLLPGLIVLPGLFKRRPNSVVWAALISLFYLTIAITDAWSLDTLRGLNIGIALLTTSLFCTAWLYMLKLRRLRKRQAASAAARSADGN